MNGWMILWTVVLAGGILGFLGLLIVVGAGSVKELRQTLDDLREDTRQATEHPETLEEAID